MIFFSRFQRREDGDRERERERDAYCHSYFKLLAGGCVDRLAVNGVCIKLCIIESSAPHFSLSLSHTHTHFSSLFGSRFFVVVNFCVGAAGRQEIRPRRRHIRLSLSLNYNRWPPGCVLVCVLTCVLACVGGQRKRNFFPSPFSSFLLLLFFSWRSADDLHIEKKKTTKKREKIEKKEGPSRLFCQLCGFYLRGRAAAFFSSFFFIANSETKEERARVCVCVCVRLRSLDS